MFSIPASALVIMGRKYVPCRNSTCSCKIATPCLPLPPLPLLCTPNPLHLLSAAATLSPSPSSRTLEEKLIASIALKTKIHLLSVYYNVNTREMNVVILGRKRTRHEDQLVKYFQIAIPSFTGRLLGIRYKRHPPPPAPRLVGVETNPGESVVDRFIHGPEGYTYNCTIGVGQSGWWGEALPVGHSYAGVRVTLATTTTAEAETRLRKVLDLLYLPYVCYPPKPLEHTLVWCGVGPVSPPAPRLVGISENPGPVCCRKCGEEVSDPEWVMSVVHLGFVPKRCKAEKCRVYFIHDSVPLGRGLNCDYCGDYVCFKHACKAKLAKKEAREACYYTPPAPRLVGVHPHPGPEGVREDSRSRPRFGPIRGGLSTCCYVCHSEIRVPGTSPMMGTDSAILCGNCRVGEPQVLTRLMEMRTPFTHKNLSAKMQDLHHIFKGMADENDKDLNGREAVTLLHLFRTLDNILWHMKTQCQTCKDKPCVPDKEGRCQRQLTADTEWLRYMRPPALVPPKKKRKAKKVEHCVCCLAEDCGAGEECEVDDEGFCACCWKRGCGCDYANGESHSVGQCDGCGEESKELVNSFCVKCIERDV